MAKIRFVSSEAMVAKIRRLLEEEGIWIHQVPSLFDIRPTDLRVIGQPAEQGGRPCFLSSGDDYVGKHCLGSLASRAAARRPFRACDRSRLARLMVVGTVAAPGKYHLLSRLKRVTSVRAKVRVSYRRYSQWNGLRCASPGKGVCDPVRSRPTRSNTPPDS
jgi:hypothetical protein